MFPKQELPVQVADLNTVVVCADDLGVLASGEPH